MNLNQIRDLVHSTAVEKGWWSVDVDGAYQTNVPEKIALMHSELSEALEEYRVHGMREGAWFYYSETGKPEGIGVELADCIIRILDFCGHFGIPIDEILEAKHEYNAQRPYRHGGKLA